MPILGFSASLGWFEVDMKIANFLPIYKGKHMNMFFFGYGFVDISKITKIDFLE